MILHKFWMVRNERKKGVFLSKWQFQIYLFIILEECHIYDERPTDPIFPNNLLEKCAEDIAHSEEHSGLPNDCQYHESSGAELESFSVTNNTTLEHHCDETAEGTFKLNPGQANEG